MKILYLLIAYLLFVLFIPRFFSDVKNEDDLKFFIIIFMLSHLIVAIMGIKIFKTDFKESLYKFKCNYKNV